MTSRLLAALVPWAAAALCTACGTEKQCYDTGCPLACDRAYQYCYVQEPPDLCARESDFRCVDLPSDCAEEHAACGCLEPHLAVECVTLPSGLLVVHLPEG